MLISTWDWILAGTTFMALKGRLIVAFMALTMARSQDASFVKYS
jgi:hypothetical protein